MVVRTAAGTQVPGTSISGEGGASAEKGVAVSASGNAPEVANDTQVELVMYDHTSAERTDASGSLNCSTVAMPCRSASNAAEMVSLAPSTEMKAGFNDWISAREAASSPPCPLTSTNGSSYTAAAAEAMRGSRKSAPLATQMARSEAPPGQARRVNSSAVAYRLAPPSLMTEAPVAAASSATTESAMATGPPAT